MEKEGGKSKSAMQLFLSVILYYTHKHTMPCCRLVSVRQQLQLASQLGLMQGFSCYWAQVCVMDKTTQMCHAYQ